MDSFDDYLERPAPAGCDAVRDIWLWSRNCSHPTPAAIFCDLIGVSEELLGITISAGEFHTLGYMELDYLADGLKEYAVRPDQVRHYVRQLLEAEGDW